MHPSRTIRVMTYNVHSCVGRDEELSPHRIAEVINTYRPDIVTLQELDVGRARSGRTDQAHIIAHQLEMDFHFHPVIQIKEEKYGDAILSRFPLRLMHSAPLPSLAESRRLERRGALWVSVEAFGHRIQVFNTHLGLHRRERVAQARALLGAEWTGHPQVNTPLILCGDFNAVPGSMAYRLLRRRLRDVQRCLGPHHRRARTFPSRYPVIRIDHIFISKEWEVSHTMVPQTDLTRMASDHLPLVADLRLP